MLRAVVGGAKGFPSGSGESSESGPTDPDPEEEETPRLGRGDPYHLEGPLRSSLRSLYAARRAFGADKGAPLFFFLSRSVRVSE